jgi:hypothetical protein
MAGQVARNALAAIARISVATDQGRGQVARNALAAIVRISVGIDQDRSPTLVKFNKD